MGEAHSFDRALGLNRRLNPLLRSVLVAFSSAALFLAILQVFTLRPFGFMLVDMAYYSYLMAFYVSLVFIIHPFSKSSAGRVVPWYDYLLFLLCFGISVYFAANGMNIIQMGWEFSAPLVAKLLSLCFWLLVLEALRRTSGLPLTIFCAFFSVYPVFAGYMPGLLRGASFPFLSIAGYHVFSAGSILGIPLQTVGNLLIGFMIFGVALQFTGGAEFFLNLALSLMGKYRGGAAKVAVVGSGLFGTLSGSVVSNIMTIGSFTIPAMKKAGYEPHYAAGIEACTSTGGALMPPVMGAVAFVMASFLAIPYSQVVIIAAVPAILYYVGLFFQVDSYAARKGLKGLPKSQLPPLGKTFRDGWYFILALVLLTGLIFISRREGEAPFYTMVALLLCAMLRKKTRLSGRRFLEFIGAGGKVMAEITAMLAGVGLVIGGLSITGVAHSLSSEIIGLAGSNVILLLAIGALVSFVLGMGMTATACYIFVALTLAPALLTSQLNPLAVHLFILYWGLISYITPPVAIAAIAAGTLAGAGAMKTGYTAMRLGAVLYFVPFFFVFNPALILVGSLSDIIPSVICAFIGLFFVAGGLEGYLAGMGELRSLSARLLLVAIGILFFMPFRTVQLIEIFVVAAVFMSRYWLKQRHRAKVAT